MALNPEDASRRRLEALLAKSSLGLQVAVQTPYAASVCEMALQGLGVGVVNPVTALDYAERGLVLRRLHTEVSFACLLVMPSNKVLSGMAQQLLSLMRQQFAEDMKRLQKQLNLDTLAHGRIAPVPQRWPACRSDARWLCIHPDVLQYLPDVSKRPAKSPC